MKIAIGADHGGYEQKEIIKKVIAGMGYDIDDVGCHSPDSVDYPDMAFAVTSKIIDGECDSGILICGTGIGMCIAANRDARIRAALCHDEFTARMSREHNDANVLCIGARVTGDVVAEQIVKVWLNSEFEGGRHQRRIAKFSN